MNSHLKFDITYLRLVQSHTHQTHTFHTPLTHSPAPPTNPPHSHTHTEIVINTRARNHHKHTTITNTNKLQHYSIGGGHYPSYMREVRGRELCPSMRGGRGTLSGHGRGRRHCPCMRGGGNHCPFNS